MTCETCLYWRRKAFGVAGLCHRFPPKQGHPETLAHDWCGEYKPAPVLKPVQPPVKRAWKRKVAP